MYETAPAEPKRAVGPMTPAIPKAALRPSVAARIARIAIATAIGVVLIATLIVTGSPREARDVIEVIDVIEPPAAQAAPAPPPPPAAPVPELVEVELTRSDVKRALTRVTRLMRSLDESPVPKEKLGPIWRELLEVRKTFEAPNADLPAVARDLDDVEAKARSLERQP